MNAEIFIANVKARCKALNTTPTAACIKSGAGKNLISNLKKGENPSVKRVELLASYLGCSVSDLTGEKKEPTVKDDGLTAEERLLVLAYRAASEDDRAVVDAALRKYKPCQIEKKVM